MKTDIPRIPRSNPFKRWQCRRIGHDWEPWASALVLERRDCQRCAVRELRRFDARAHWGDKRQFVRRTLFGRLTQWAA